MFMTNREIDDRILPKPTPLLAGNSKIAVNQHAPMVQILWTAVGTDWRETPGCETYSRINRQECNCRSKQL